MTIPGEAEGRRFTVETLPANLAAYRYVIKLYNSGKRTRQLEPRT